jgi:hypothetical protein
VFLFTRMGLPTSIPPPLTQEYETFAAQVADAELLLTHGIETGADIPVDVAGPILAARSAETAGVANELTRAAFYASYARLAKQFDKTTAQTIRESRSAETHKMFRRLRWTALCLTAFIAMASVFTFVTNSISDRIMQDIATGNDAAAKLRVSLTASNADQSIGEVYAQRDPCTLLETSPNQGEKMVRSTDDVETLQKFAATLRDLHSRALKLNKVVRWVGMVEVDPLEQNFGPDVRAQTQLKPAILNYTAETLCKIQTYQTVRIFATNVHADYVAMMGATASYALPIFYAWLGAYAFRLRVFGEMIRNLTYAPSFADSARTIMAIIAGAIAGLFNPAQDLALSPLATAFLVGYGVELFFRFLDALIGAFGPPSARGAKTG